MKQQITLVRAISSEFVRRKVVPLGFGVGGVLVAALLITLWLTTKSVWWWLFVVVEVIGMMVATIIFMVAFVALRTLRPQLTESQQASVVAFVDKMERNLEHVQTPLLLIEFRVLRDLIWPREESFIKSVAKDSTTLHKDFLQLSRDFDAL